MYEAALCDAPAVTQTHACKHQQVHASAARHVCNRCEAVCSAVLASTPLCVALFIRGRPPARRTHRTQKLPALRPGSSACHLPQEPAHGPAAPGSAACTLVRAGVPPPLLLLLQTSQLAVGGVKRQGGAALGGGEALQGVWRGHPGGGWALLAAPGLGGAAGGA